MANNKDGTAKSATGGQRAGYQLGRLALLLCMAQLLVTGTALSQIPWKDKTKGVPQAPVVRFTSEMIEVSTATCDALTSDPGTSVDDTALRNKLREMTAKGEAVLLDTASVTSHQLGEPSAIKAEASREDIYQTEYEPPDSRLHRGLDGKFPVPESYLSCLIKPFMAFEQRNIGVSLVVYGATTADEGKTHQVEFGLSWVGRQSDTVHSKIKEPVMEVEIKSPTFFTMQLVGQAILRAGAPTRVGILSPKGPDGLPDPTRKVIVFLRAETLVVPP